MPEVSIGLFIALTLPLVIGIFISVSILAAHDEDIATLREEYRKIGD